MSRVSLTMIVRDEESNLPRCLRSVAGMFDEIVIVDTGSRDRTREIARSFGAQVFDFEWVDSFSAARNLALDQATGDYAFWLDADDELLPPDREKLQILFDSLRPDDPAAYAPRYDSLNSDGELYSWAQVRLWPRIPRGRWTRRVHEFLQSDLFYGAIPVRHAFDITITHHGYLDDVKVFSKRRRNLALLLAELAEHDDKGFDPLTMHCLATVCYGWGESTLALQCYSLAIRESMRPARIAEIVRLQAHCLHRLGRHVEAMKRSDLACRLDPTDPHVWRYKGISYGYVGDYISMAWCLCRALDLSRPGEFVDVGSCVFLPAFLQEAAET